MISLKQLLFNYQLHYRLFKTKTNKTRKIPVEWINKIQRSNLKFKKLSQIVCLS
jgi:hypothetical protein